MEDRKVAGVGTGAAGPTTSHVLATASQVTLYEADGRPGGDARTREPDVPGSRVGPRTFIREYAFPGGVFPSREGIAERSAAGPRTAHDHTCGEHYGEHCAETLRLWRERFAARRPAVTALGVAPVFQRLGESHLAHSEAAPLSRSLFRSLSFSLSRSLDVRQLLLTEGTHR
ncbi:class I SAM-dependent methyltransferase [Streptomyces sp. NPDC057411]|uniref:class I SAM-dependent methyltransferase n=1 Tax=unclassified Streptomyces TaxID=2593676 RepID=UPI0036260B68